MAEQDAYVEMVDWLSGFMTYFPAAGFDRNDYPDRVGLEVFHGFQSNMEEMAFALDEIGILESIPVDPSVLRESDRSLEGIRLRQMPPARRAFTRCRIFLRDTLRKLGLIAPAPVRQAAPNQFRFVVPPDRVRDMACKAYEAGSPSFEEILNCFIYNAACYSSLPDARTPFAAPAQFLPALEELSKLGYATKEGDRFRWTDAIIPAMVQGCCWTEEGESRTEIEKEEIQQLIRDMPDDVRQRVLEFFRQDQKINAMAYLFKEVGWDSSAALHAVNSMHEDWKKANRRS